MRTLQVGQVLEVQRRISVHHPLTEGDGIAGQALSQTDPAPAQLFGVLTNDHRRANHVGLLVPQIDDTAGKGDHGLKLGADDAQRVLEVERPANRLKDLV